MRDPVFGSSIVGVQYGGCGEEGLVVNLPFDTLVQGETVPKELGIHLNTLVQGETVPTELGIHLNTLVQGGSVSRELDIHFNTLVQGEQYLEI